MYLSIFVFVKWLEERPVGVNLFLDTGPHAFVFIKGSWVLLDLFLVIFVDVLVPKSSQVAEVCNSSLFVSSFVLLLDLLIKGGLFFIGMAQEVVGDSGGVHQGDLLSIQVSFSGFLGLSDII